MALPNQPGPTESNPLDRPPPTTALDTPQRSPQTMADLASPQAAGTVPADQIPEPVLRGVLEGGQQIEVMLQSFQQILPEFAADFTLVSVALQRALGRVVTSGAPAVGSTNAGPSFPAGGMASGPMR